MRRSRVRSPSAPPFLSIKTIYYDVFVTRTLTTDAALLASGPLNLCALRAAPSDRACMNSDWVACIALSSQSCVPSYGCSRLGRAFTHVRVRATAHFANPLPEGEQTATRGRRSDSS